MTSTQGKGAAVLFDLDNTIFDHYHSLKLAISSIQSNFDGIEQHDTQDLISKYNASLQKAYTEYLKNEITYEEADLKKYPDQAFALPSEPPIVILPHGLINRLKSAPETQLSADKEVCRRGLGQYTDLGTPMPGLFHAIQIDLTRHVRDLVPTLQNQVAYAFERHLRLADEQDWKDVTAFEFVKRVVTILNATAFVGTELARNEEWQEIAYNYSSDLRRAFDALNSWHPWLRPFVHPFIFRNIGFSARRQRVAEMLRPLIRKNETSSPRTHTLLNYIISRLPPKDRDDSRLMARMQLRAALAGSDTVAQALTNAVFDIASDAGCAEQLRGEVSDLASATQDGRWDMTMLRSMSKLDSLLRESARLWAPFLLAMGRITTSPLRLDDGTVVPKDTTVYFDMYNAHRTPDKSHIEDMTSFNGLRFSEWRERDKLPNKYLAATTGADNLPFGHGAHSCPGRFFAVAEMKVVLCHLLLDENDPTENLELEWWTVTPAQEEQIRRSETLKTMPLAIYGRGNSWQRSGQDKPEWRAGE
ncbi:Cytochrome P450 monooxygenase BOA7 [Colletotrichum spinosum]|uniref:Cytochrome P450 monooxygenase BOA7 n=1 Tax=Colletotrichum spinosum TaxID=1347390 RepID=A0A4R8Q5X9_9PEZI|nr:Cytochrome P450 monooxygenase BOA7 [Colletotrichum spinosum]